MSTDTPNLGTSADVNLGARGVLRGGINPSQVDTIEYVNIASPGNAIDFGDLIQILEVHLELVE